MNRRSLPALAILSTAFLLTCGRATAGDLMPIDPPFETGSPLPAVSGVNVSMDFFGGASDGGDIAGSNVSLALPLGFRTGTQIDILAARLDEEFFGSISDHLFWRDPSRGLVGLYGSYAHYEGFGGVEAWRLAAEGEIYLGRTTIRALAGVEGGDADRVTTTDFIFDYEIDQRFFDKVDLVFYPSDDLQIFVGHRYTGGEHAIAAGAEYLWRSHGEGMTPSTFIEGRIGEDDDEAIWAGLRLYFGSSDKSLIRRHREDDPIQWEPDTFLGIAAKLRQEPGIPAFIP